MGVIDDKGIQPHVIDDPNLNPVTVEICCAQYRLGELLQSMFNIWISQQADALCGGGVECAKNGDKNYFQISLL